MSLPALTSDQLTSDLMLEACQNFGAFYLRAPALNELQHRVLGQAQAFFSLPGAEKRALSIETSPEFRGYSRMLTKDDDREQLHFGPEAARGSDAQRT